MDLVRFDPFSIFGDLERFVDRSPAGRAWAPRLDVFERDKDLVVRVDIAGVAPEDIDITIEGRTLTVTGSRSVDESVEERGYHRREILTGEFKRTLLLPGGVDAEAISANADQGMLEIVVPLKPEVLPRKVKIDVVG